MHICRNQMLILFMIYSISKLTDQLVLFFIYRNDFHLNKKKQYQSHNFQLILEAFLRYHIVAFYGYNVL